jgi:hypothetical protein
MICCIGCAGRKSGLSPAPSATTTPGLRVQGKCISVCYFSLAFNCSPYARRAPVGRACSLGYACHSSCSSGRLRSGSSSVLVREFVTQPPSCPSCTTRRAIPTHSSARVARLLRFAVHFGRPLLTRTLRDARSSLFVNVSAEATRCPIFVRHLPVAGRLSNDLASAKARAQH